MPSFFFMALMFMFFLGGLILVISPEISAQHREDRRDDREDRRDERQERDLKSRRRLAKRDHAFRKELEESRRAFAERELARKLEIEALRTAKVETEKALLEARRKVLAEERESERRQPARTETVRYERPDVGVVGASRKQAVAIPAVAASVVPPPAARQEEILEEPIEGELHDPSV